MFCYISIVTATFFLRMSYMHTFLKKHAYPYSHLPTPPGIPKHIPQMMPCPFKDDVLIDLLGPASGAHMCVGVGQTLEHRQPVGDHTPDEMILLPSSQQPPLMEQLDCAQETTAAVSSWLQEPYTSRRQRFTALWLLERFQPLFCDVPWALLGKGLVQMSHLGLGTHTSLILSTLASQEPLLQLLPMQGRLGGGASLINVFLFYFV